MVAATAPELKRGDVLAGRYQIEAVIGNGGSGRVLRAFDRVTRTPVALKILRPEFAADPVWTERFSRELRVGRQIQHPNVCRVFDIGDSDGNRFLSMELATGGTVRAQMEPGAAPRSTEDRIADARALIAGVAALHAAGIVHRDIKPENVLRMEDGRLIVSDFGLATDPGAGPATTVMIGTPRYMAPEVVMGDPATARSDVWALGVVLHELLSGQRPDRTLIKRRRRIYTPPEVGSPKERRLVELSARCSEEDPEERPASAVEVAREFEAAVRGVRFTRKAVQKQIAWGAVALAALATLGLIRNRWTSRAVASSSQMAMAVGSDRVLELTGRGEDWSKGSTRLAAFPGKLHCFSLVKAGTKVRAIWGTPRKAEEVDIKTGVRVSATLLPDTYVDECPQESPNGKSLLFTRATKRGSQVFLSNSPDGQDATEIVRGALPEWLPNGQDFAFELDFHHAAIFSIPTGQMTVISDGISVSRQLAEKTLDPKGHLVAVRYTTDATENLVVVQALPSLRLLGQFRVPQSAHGIKFSGRGDKLLFSLDGANGVSEMASATWQRPSLKRLGSLPAADIEGLLDAAGVEIVASRRMRRNLWSGEERSRQITHDGRSYEGSLSVYGDVVIQRRLADGRYVIVLRRADGSEKQVTNGPMDMTPTFFADGTRWLHANYSSHEIVECRVSNLLCAPLVSDPLTPVLPSIDLGGHQVAYMTFMNTPRLHLFSLASKKDTDLGTIKPECAPFWSSSDRLWVGQTIGNQLVWAEIDSTTGGRTGRVRSTLNRHDQECSIPDELLQGKTLRPVSVVIEQSSELFRRTAR